MAETKDEYSLEEKLLHLLVAELKGHSITIKTGGAFKQEQLGFSVGNKKSIKIDDIIQLVISQSKTLKAYHAILDRLQRGGGFAYDPSTVKLIEIGDDIPEGAILYACFR